MILPIMFAIIFSISILSLRKDGKLNLSDFLFSIMVAAGVSVGLWAVSMSFIGDKQTREITLSIPIESYTIIDDTYIIEYKGDKNKSEVSVLDIDDIRISRDGKEVINYKVTYVQRAFTTELWGISEARDKQDLQNMSNSDIMKKGHLESATINLDDIKRKVEVK